MLVKSKKMTHYICMKKKFLSFTLSVFIFAFLGLPIFAQSNVSSSISGLKVTLKNASPTQAIIELTWEIPSKNNIVAFNIYRSNEQITKDTIKKLKPIIVLKGRYTRYTDTVTDISASYFYCVTTKISTGEEFDIIIPMVNSTVIPLVIAPVTANEKTLPKEETRVETPENERALIPLPYLNELEDANASKKEVSSRDLTVAKKLANHSDVKKTKDFQILPADITPDTGEQYLLSTIVNGSFKNAEWNKALAEIDDFIKINRSEETLNRAYFYLGQIYYYKGDSKNAIFSFMKSQNDYPIESHQWIDEVLNSLEL